MAEMWLRDVDERSTERVTSLHPFPVKDVADERYIAVGDEQITVADTAIGCSAAQLNKHPDRIVCRVETAQIRFRIAGTAPTSSVGTQLEAGDELTIDGNLNIERARFIRTGSTSATLNVIYFKRERGIAT